MAPSTSIVPQGSAVRAIRLALNRPELIELIDHLTESTGRPSYGGRALLGVCLVRHVYQLPTLVSACRLVAEHTGLQQALGGAPSDDAVYRFTKKLLRHRAPLERALALVIETLRGRIDGFGVNVAIDSTDMRAWANGQSRSPSVAQRGGFADSDAAWGRRSGVSTRKGGGFYGFKLHMASCTLTDLPLAWEVRPANNHDMRWLEPLIDRLRWLPETVSADKGYDGRPCYQACEHRGIIPVIAQKRGTKFDTTMIDRASKRWKQLYKARTAVEREFARLKELRLDAFRVRRLERVQLHADLCVLARLTLAL